jgi:hypothetical protein
MMPVPPRRRHLLFFFLLAGNLLWLPVRAQDLVVPQIALSPCPVVSVAARETLTAGAGLGVSPDGRWLAVYLHTNRGGEVTLRARESGEAHRIELVPPALPPGVTWRVMDATFSPSSELLAIRSTGSIWIIDVASGKSLYQVALDPERQLYPGRLSLAANTLAVFFWLPESYFAEAKAKHGADVRFYEAATGKLLRTLPLALESSDAWVEMKLSPDASRIAVLRRATRWPGKARLNLFAADSGKLLWEAKISAEDFQWTGDGQSLYALGGRLMTLDAATGRQKSESKAEFGSTEYQRLRLNETANLAVGQFLHYSRWRRGVLLNDRRESVLVLWRLEKAEPLCEMVLPPPRSVEAWVTPRGEIITLEELYDLRPQLRLLKSAQMVVYTLNPK